MRCWIAGLALVFATGCVQRMALNTQIKAARDARGAIATLHDYEVARHVALSGLGQLEMLHHMAPDNEDALMLLLQAWTGAASGFIEDEYERALDAEDGPLAEYHRARARAAYTRALHYGQLLVGQQAQGFDAVRHNADELERWLATHFDTPESAELLLWFGQAWLSRVGVSQDDPAVVAERYIGVAFLTHSAKLDSTASNALAQTILGAYYANSGDPTRGKRLLDQARTQHGGTYLPWHLAKARLHCAIHDEPQWEQTLTTILQSGDPLPSARLENTIAMRRARRYLASPRWRVQCQFPDDS